MSIHSVGSMPYVSGTALSVLLLIAVRPLQIQSQTGTRPRFEAASVKLDVIGGANRNEFSVLPGRLRVVNGRLRMLIAQAYGLKQSFQFVGGPNWINSTRYDIQAKAETPPPPDQLMLMLQDLFEDRFKLKAHRETRELPVFCVNP